VTLTQEQVARVTYEANRAYCEIIGEPTLPFEAVADSVVDGVAALVADPSLTPEELHRRWYAKKVSDGWIYGKVKDAEKKTHPQMVIWNQLPEEQRIKDYLFQAIVRVLARLPKGFVHA
jgi:RyR domain